MRKVMYGWYADKDKVKDGNLCCYKNGVPKSIIPSSHLKQAGIFIDGNTYILFDDETDKMEFFFNDRELPNWVAPLILSKEDIQKVPNRPLDIYTIECVRDLIYWWFEVYCHRELFEDKKERIAKLVGLNFHREKYYKFIDYGFSHPAYIKWLEESYKNEKGIKL